MRDDKEKKVGNICDKNVRKVRLKGIVPLKSKKNYKKEESLSQGDNIWVNIINTVPDWILLTDLEGYILRTNKVCGKFVNIPVEKMPGQKCCKVIHGAKKHLPGCPLKKMLNTGERIETEFQLPGSNRWIAVRVSPVTDSEGKINKAVHIIRDITGQRQTREMLIEREGKFKSIFDNANDIIVFVTRSGTLLEINNKIKDMLGYEPNELIGKSFMTCGILAARNALKIIKLFTDSVIRGGFPDKNSDLNVTQVWLNHKDGYPVEVEASTALIKKNGKLKGFVSILRDITEYKRANEIIKASEVRYRELFNGINSGVAVYEVQNNGTQFIIKDLNHAGERIDQIKKEDVIGKDVTTIFHGIKEFGLFDIFQRVWRTGRPLHYPVMFYRDERITGWRENYVYRLSSDEIVAVYEDVTERKQFEESILEYQKRLKSLASQLTLTEEKERHRIATALHDQIGQYLAVSRIELTELLHSKVTKDVQKSLEKTNEWLCHAIEETRSLTYDLSSPVLHELGFEKAVAALLEDEVQRKHKIRTEFQTDGLTKVLDDDISTLLFRNVRELLFNVIKHAHAEKVEIFIRTIGNNIQVKVEDDGVGFNPAEVAAAAAIKTKFGLFSIRERLEYFGGNIEIDSSPGKGCRITLTAPLKK